MSDLPCSFRLVNANFLVLSILSIISCVHVRNTAKKCNKNQYKIEIEIAFIALKMLLICNIFFFKM